MDLGVLVYASMIAFTYFLGMVVGARAERYRRDKEVAAFEMPEDDSAYWRRMYDALADEWNEAHGWKSFPARVLEKQEDARKQTST